jgi:hypothetical protein
MKNIDPQDAQRMLDVLHKETKGKLMPSKKIIEYIITYIKIIPEDVRGKYTLQELLYFLEDCWSYGTFKKW